MRGYSAIGLDNPKFPINLGSVMRAAGCFDVAMVGCSGKRIKPGATDTMKHYRHLPLVWTEDLHNLIPYDCVPVAVELVKEAAPLTTYSHPERAFYVFGGEDATLGARVLQWCRDIIYVPTNGCLNLSACVNIVLYDRLMKRQ